MRAIGIGVIRFCIKFSLLTAMWCGFVSQAAANLITIDFTAAGPWSQFGNVPFGLTPDPTLSGSVTIDTSICGTFTGQCNGQSVTAINWVTGTLPWTLSTISVPASYIYFSNGQVASLYLQSTVYGGENSIVLSYNRIAVYGSVGISNNFDSALVSYNVTGSGLGLDYVGPAPIPSTLSLFVTGLGALGLLGWFRKRKRCAYA